MFYFLIFFSMQAFNTNKGFGYGCKILIGIEMNHFDGKRSIKQNEICEKLILLIVK